MSNEIFARTDLQCIIITTMVEQTDEERYIIPGNYHCQKLPSDVFFAEAGLQAEQLQTA